MFGVALWVPGHVIDRLNDGNVWTIVAEMQMAATASTVSLGTSSTTIKVPRQKAASLEIISRKSTVYEDKPSLEVVYILRDPYKRSRVDTSGLQVQMSIDGAQGVDCDDPGPHGTGRCNSVVSYR